MRNQKCAESILVSRRCLVRAAAFSATVGVSQFSLAKPAVAQRGSVRFADFVAVGRCEWEEFKRRFLAPDGRIIDTGNGDCSHSEGQGWGLLFAVAFNDRPAFESILAWTIATLRRPSDYLHAWRYQPNLPFRVADWNNATDGDLFIACALWRAARRWGCAEHATLARRIAGDMLRLLVRTLGAHTVLLPGAEGFDFADSVTVNPSYYAFPMLAELAEAVPSPLWSQLSADGQKLIDAGRFGFWRLPPDWLRVGRDGSLEPHPHWPPRFSYDAIRVPLYLAWSGGRCREAQDAFVSFWARNANPPAWVDLVTGARAQYRAPPGMAAVARVASVPREQKIDVPLDLPAVRASPDYYSAALILLSRLACQERYAA